MIFSDYTEACKHFFIDTGFEQSKSVIDDIRAYQLLGNYLVSNNLTFHQLCDGSFEIIDNSVKNNEIAEKILNDLNIHREYGRVHDEYNLGIYLTYDDEYIWFTNAYGLDGIWCEGLPTKESLLYLIQLAKSDTLGTRPY